MVDDRFRWWLEQLLLLLLTAAVAAVAVADVVSPWMFVDEKQ